MNTEQKIDAILAAVETLAHDVKELDDKLVVVVSGIGRLETAGGTAGAPSVAPNVDLSPLSEAIASVAADLAALKAEFVSPAPVVETPVPNAPVAPVTGSADASTDAPKAAE